MGGRAMSKQQTAVEWLEHMFEYGFVFERKQKEKIDSMFAQAKRKECEQIAKAWERRAMNLNGYDYQLEATMSKQQTDLTAMYYEGMRINAHKHYSKMVIQTGNSHSLIHEAIDFYCEYQKLSRLQRIIQAIQFKRKRFNPPLIDETPISNNFNQNLQAYIGGDHE
jgi:hypothetical protein